MKRKIILILILITIALSLAIICLISSAATQGTEELGGIRIAFVEIDEGNCIIGIEDVGCESNAKGTLFIEINNTLLNPPINISLRGRSLSHYVEHEIKLECSPTLILTSKDENNIVTSKATIEYMAHTYIYLELTNLDGFTSTSELRQPSRHVDKGGDWLNCIWG